VGIEFIRVDKAQNQVETKREAEHYAQLSFRSYDVPSPEMSIWVMLAEKDQKIFPWWSYEAAFDQDIHALNNAWSVVNAQGLFDCLFLSLLKRTMGPNFYVIFPGNIKSENWGQVQDKDKEFFLKGQGCVYHLQAAFDTKLNVSWVPFWQPQSVIRDPSFGNFWRLFMNSQSEDVSKSISFFQLSNPRHLPGIVNLLVEADDNRSEKFAGLVEWFGVYTSPLAADHVPGALVYSKHKQIMEKFTDLQKTFSKIFEQTQVELAKNPKPQTALRILSRTIAL